MAEQKRKMVQVPLFEVGPARPVEREPRKGPLTVREAEQRTRYLEALGFVVVYDKDSRSARLRCKRCPPSVVWSSKLSDTAMRWAENHAAGHT